MNTEGRTEQWAGFNMASARLQTHLMTQYKGSVDIWARQVNWAVQGSTTSGDKKYFRFETPTHRPIQWVPDAIFTGTERRGEEGRNWQLTSI